MFKKISKRGSKILKKEAVLMDHDFPLLSYFNSHINALNYVKFVHCCTTKLCMEMELVKKRYY